MINIIKVNLLATYSIMKNVEIIERRKDSIVLIEQKDERSTRKYRDRLGKRGKIDSNTGHTSTEASMILESERYN